MRKHYTELEPMLKAWNEFHGIEGNIHMIGDYREDTILHFLPKDLSPRELAKFLIPVKIMDYHNGVYRVSYWQHGHYKEERVDESYLTSLGELFDKS